MDLDKNKTCATHRATACAAAYLNLRGFKPIETEVPVYAGWVADLASYVYPTNIELEKLKIVGKKQTRYGHIIDTEAVAKFENMCGQGPFTALVEVKVTKGAYKNDVDFKFGGYIYPAHFCYLAYPKGVVEKPPKGWIGLVLNERCDRITKVDKSNFIYGGCHAQHPGDIIDLIANVGIRRHHRTHGTALRAFVKSYNADETKRKRSWTIHSALKVIEEYIFGDGEKQLDKMLADHCVSRAAPKKWIMEIAVKIKTKLQDATNA